MDTTKVSRSALQNAASVAGFMLTTEAIISEKQKEEKPLPPIPGGVDEMY